MIISIAIAEGVLHNIINRPPDKSVHLKINFLIS